MERTSLDKLKDNIAKSISKDDEDIFNLYVDVVLDLISDGMTLSEATNLVKRINGIHLSLMVKLYKLEIRK
jgi:hypoxanthine-guanine phosphoribosyltransferase